MLLLLAWTASANAAIKLVVDRDRVVVGETVNLTFLTDDTQQALNADFSVLEDDFVIIDRRNESQISIVNGRQTAVARLLLTVEPRREGNIVIPSFRFGDDVTEPVTLRVEPAPELAEGELPPVFIEAEVSPADGPYYVHAQFGLVVRVFYRQNLTEATISQPEPAPASVSLLQETPYQAERGGERYRVLERHYAIFPERSGELVIPSMELSGRLVERQSQGVWQPSVRGRRVREQSPEIRLQIEPRPDAFTGAEWQPARELSVSQQISSSDTLRVGEPVTRTVIVDAVGLAENMIAEPAWPEVPDTRVYPDQPQGITRDDGRWVLGHKEFRYAVVPEREGELTLPELRVEWWDTVNGKQRTAVLPAHTLTVQPSALVPPAEPAVVAPQIAYEVPSPEAAVTERVPWKWLTLLFAVLWLLTLLVAWRLGAGRTPNGPARARPAGEEEEADLLDSLAKACRRNDRVQARVLLVRWLRLYGPDGDPSVISLARTAGDETLREGLLALDADGFAPGLESTWKGSEFWKAFEAWRKAQSTLSARAAPMTDLWAKENRLKNKGSE